MSVRALVAVFVLQGMNRLFLFQVVWLLAKLSVQSPFPPGIGSDCQCNVEVSGRGLTTWYNNVGRDVLPPKWLMSKSLDLSLCPLLL